MRRPSGAEDKPPRPTVAPNQSQAIGLVGADLRAHPGVLGLHRERATHDVFVQGAHSFPPKRKIRGTHGLACPDRTIEKLTDTDGQKGEVILYERER